MAYCMPTRGIQRTPSLVAYTVQRATWHCNAHVEPQWRTTAPAYAVVYSMAQRSHSLQSDNSAINASLRAVIPTLARSYDKRSSKAVGLSSSAQCESCDRSSQFGVFVCVLVVPCVSLAHLDAAAMRAVARCTPSMCHTLFHAVLHTAWHVSHARR